MRLVGWRQAVLVPGLQLPGSSVRSAMMSASHAMPSVALSSRPAARIMLTAVPCPLMSEIDPLPEKSREALLIRPARAPVGSLMPVSITPTATPAPLAPAS